MSELSSEFGAGGSEPEEILRRLPDSERELFLAEYRAALDAAHEVWRFRGIRELLSRWQLVAAATSRPGYAEALADARARSGPYDSLEDVVAKRRSR